jgi:hypothetical protein
MVPANFFFDRTRAASMVPARPLALSLAPGESDVPFSGSLTRESMSPAIIAIRSGSRVPRWMASPLTTSVGSGIRGTPEITSLTVITSRQPAQSADILLNSSSIQRRAAPIPRVSDTVSESV